MADNKPTEPGKFTLAPGRWQTGDVHGDDLDRVIREAPLFAPANRPPIKTGKGTKYEPGEA